MAEVERILTDNPAGVNRLLAIAFDLKPARQVNKKKKENTECLSNTKTA